jgi:hypothetical protein
MEMEGRQMLIGQMLQKNTTRPQKVTGRGTGINSKYVGIVLRNHYLIFMVVGSSRVWQSGMSDDQLTDKALEMWSSRNNNKPFHLLHMWKVVRGEQKWSAYLARLKKENEKSKMDNPAQVVNLDLDGEKRPVGHKKAKKELNGKRKSYDALADFSDKFDKFIETSTKIGK